MGKGDFDKGDLKDELKNAGFEDCDADNIADRVNDRKMDDWTQDNARAEALKEIEQYVTNVRNAYDNFRSRNVSNMSTSNMPSDTTMRSNY